MTRQLQLSRTKLSYYSSLIKTLHNPATLLQLHAHIITSGAASPSASASNSPFLSNHLINAYFSLGPISNAHKLFHHIPLKNLFSWTILIFGFTKRALFHQALDSFAAMLATGLLPNEFTISSILPAFPKLALPLMAKSVHAFWVRHRFRHNVVVETSLVDMYSRFGCLTIARNVFDEMPVRNLVSWNVIISGYAHSGMSDDAQYLFNLMRNKGFSFDYFTIMSLILASSGPTHPTTSSAIHGFVIRLGYYRERQIQTALIDMYTSRNFIDAAYGVFDEMPVKDMVASTVMLKGFSSGQLWTKAMEHLSDLVSVHYMSLDSTAFVSMISSCSCLRALPQGRVIHTLVVKRGFTKDVFVGSAFIDMYVNCCDLGSANKCFSEMEDKDITCWNAMIRAMGVNGNGSDAIALFRKMEELGFTPNESTFVSILSACSHAGMIDEGLKIFDEMVKRKGKVVPNLQHYGCLVDLLGRSGWLDEAHLVIARIPLQLHSGAYNAFLSACRVYGNTKVGTEIYQELLKLDIKDVGHLNCVSNLYSTMGDWERKEMSDILLRSKGMKKHPGCSLIDISN